MYTTIIGFVLIFALLFYFTNNRIEHFSRSGMLGVARSDIPPPPPPPPPPPIDPVITQSALQKYMNENIKRSTLWCTDGTCKFGNITISELDASRSIQKALYDKMLDNYIYQPDGAIIYQNIFDAKDKRVIEKIGNPIGYDDTTYAPGKTLWEGRSIINYGSKVNPLKNGLLVHVPEEYEVVWLRVHNDSWTVVTVQVVSTGEIIGRFATGYRRLNNLTPDGTLGSDGHWQYHLWMPIPLPRNKVGDIVLTTSHTDANLWISGIAFSKNPWKHAMNSAVSYHWALNNPGTPEDKVVNDHKLHGIEWVTGNWNNDQLIRVHNTGLNAKATLYVPVVPSGRDKLIYAAEHDSNWLGTGHIDMTINDKPIERFRSTYDNPFSRHFNGKMNMRYIAAKIPKEYISPQDKFVKLEINMKPTNHGMFFREVGTHDLFPDIPT